MTYPAPTLVLYDGVCALCNGFVRFLLARDRHDQFRFAPLQGTIAGDILGRFRHDASDLKTVCVVAHYGLPGARFLRKSDATVYAVSQLGGPWKMAVLARLIPRFLRNAVYDLVARYRYRVFGKYEACAVPPPAERAKFLE